MIGKQEKYGRTWNAISVSSLSICLPSFVWNLEFGIFPPRLFFLFPPTPLRSPSALSTSTSVSTSKRGAALGADAPRGGRPFRRFRLALLLPVVIGVALFEPHTFRFLVGQALRVEAWRHGAKLQIERIDGSILQPVTLVGVHWSSASHDGAVTRIDVKEAAAEFAWRALFKQGSARWLERLTLDGVTGKMTVPSEAVAEKPRWRWQSFLPRTVVAPAPERIEARDVDFVLQTNGDYVRLERAHFTLSETEPGVFAAGQLVVMQPWLRRTFRELRGTTKIEGSDVEIADIELEPGVRLERVAAKLDDIARGNLNAVGKLAAFDGEVRFDAQALPSARPFAVEFTIPLAQINVAKLAAFLALPNAAGGTIKDGMFKFRGSPHQWQNATATLRIDATNFQWDARQWDSLVLGATLMNGRVEVPQLSLLQGHNRLDLDGEFALPEAGRQWWQSSFDVRIKATIDNLTELSALILPEFRYAAGQATIAGSVRGREEKFDGQLIVSGAHLQWRSAPIDELDAALKFNGNELHVSNLSVFNAGDFVRGRGVVNILGPTQYWGELRAAVQDLGRYAALLQPPIVPEPLAGGATVEWNGEGSAKGHTGSFRAQLNKLRSLGASAALLHPINANLEGTYSPGRMLFSQFALSDDESSFSANVAVGDHGLSLRAIKLRNKQSLWLEGDAVLPLDLWRAWPNTSLAGLLDATAPTSVQLTAYNLGLREASALTGWNFPIEGVVAGNFTAEGKLGALKTAGHLALTRGRFWLGWDGGGWLSDVAADAAFAEQSMTLQRLAGRHLSNDFRAAGAVNFADVRDPALKLTLACDRMRFGLLHGVGGASRAEAEVALACTIEGTAGTATVRGEMRPLALDIRNAPDLTALWNEIEARTIPALFPPLAASLSGWSLDLACATREPLALETNPGRATIDARIGGTANAPEWTGAVSFSKAAAVAGTVPLTVENAVLTFRAGHPRNPTLALVTTGAVYGEPFTAHFHGPLSHLLRDTDCAPPLTDAAIRDFLAGDGTAHADGARFSLQVPPILTGGAEVFDWPAIGNPPPPAPAGVAQ